MLLLGMIAAVSNGAGRGYSWQVDKHSNLEPPLATGASLATQSIPSSSRAAAARRQSIAGAAHVPLRVEP